MMRCLFISNDLYRDGTGGNRVSRANLELISAVYRGELFTLSFSSADKASGDHTIVLPQPVGKIRFLLKTIKGFLGYLDGGSQAEIVRTVLRLGPEIVFVDTSQFGRLTRILRYCAPKVRVVCFFHNVEAIYYLDRLKKEGVKILPLLVASYYNEVIAVWFSHKIASLNSRDARKIERIYGRKVDEVLGLSLVDTATQPSYIKSSNTKIEYLFIGSNFYANLEGIRWFVRNVASKVDATLLVVGKGLDFLSEELSGPNVEVLGTVNDLESVYRRAAFVVLPIFSGSGMKVKTAEALMHGKFVLGTREAFEGYDIVTGLHGSRCETAEEFFNGIQSILGSGKPLGFNMASRQLYEQHHSIVGNSQIMGRLLT